ncbi:MAG: radical SAM protein [Deltaproteobacteria bacterium]|nr:radical SAM protein [Deltaproteobacteria bacterium]
MKFILHLTKECNLRCAYCYAGKHGETLAMTDEIAFRAVDMAISEGKNNACISFFGGEPLLKFPQIKTISEYALKQGIEKKCKIHFRMSTNGTLFTEEILEFCRKNKVYFALSLDGNKESHDLSRHLPDGSSSFDIIDSKLDMILTYNPYTVVTHVITPDNVYFVSDSMNWMWERGLRFVAHQVDFSDERWTPELFVILKKQYEELGKWYLKAARSGTHFFMTLFDEKLKTHINAPIFVGDVCDFGRTKVSVAPDGTIFPCVRFVSDDPDSLNYVIGNVGTGFTKSREYWIMKNLEGRPQCDGCSLVGRCANYCGCTNWTTTGSINEVSPVLCEHEKMVIEIADNLGEILWKEKNPWFIAKHYKVKPELLDLLIEKD